MLSVSLDSAGWTVVGESSDTRKIYVSSSTGNDNGDGSQGSPVQSLSKAKSMVRDNMPDWILLKTDDTWTDETFGSWTKSGRSTSEPMLIGSYGTGARPKIDTFLNNGLECVGGLVSPVRHLYIMGLEFYTSTYDGRNRNSIQGLRFQRQGSDFLVENCKVRGYSGNLIIANPDAPVSDFKVRRNQFLDAYQYTGHAQGMYISSGATRVLVEENLFDHNGWKYQSDKNMFNHNMYINTGATDIVIKGNIVTRGSLRGTLMRSGGTVIDNFYAQNGVAVQVGNTDSVVSNNVMLEGTDLPGLPSGVGVDAAFSIQNLTVTNNIIAHDTSGYTFNSSGINVNSGTINSNVSANIVYDWRRNLINSGSNTTAADNQLQDFDGYHVVIDHRTGAKQYSDSSYYSTRVTPFKISNANKTYSEWLGNTGDDSAFGSIRYLDPNRGPASYAKSLGGAATFESWIGEVRNQSKSNWNTALMAAGINSYIREGFTLAPATTLPLVGVAATRATTTEGSGTLGQFTFTRSGDTSAALAVEFLLAGPAKNGSDFSQIPLTVTIPSGQSSVILSIAGINDSIGELDEVVKVELQSTTNYKTDFNAVATVKIIDANGGFTTPQGNPLPGEDPYNPGDPGNGGDGGGGKGGGWGEGTTGSGGSGGSQDVTPTGTGLFGEYYDTEMLTQLAFTQIDAGISMDWSSGAPAANMGNDLFSVRWQGQIQPQYTENYNFFLVADDGVKLWIDGELVVDAWNHSDLKADADGSGAVGSEDFNAFLSNYGMTSGGQKAWGDFNRDRKVNTVDFNLLAGEFGQQAIFGLQEFDGFITLEAGAKYDIKLEYWESTQLSSVQLEWESPSRTREVVPSIRLYPLAAPGGALPGSLPGSTAGSSEGENHSYYPGFIPSAIFSNTAVQNPVTGGAVADDAAADETARELLDGVLA